MPGHPASEAFALHAGAMRLSRLLRSTSNGWSSVWGSVLFASAVLLSRIALLAVLHGFTHGQETSSDSEMLIDLAEHPFALLAGHTERNGQHPPLLGVLQGAVYLPLRAVASAYVALRLTYVVYEAIAAFFFAELARLVLPSWRAARWALLGMALLPVGWITSTVMAQDEVIATSVIVGVSWLQARGYPRAALLAAGTGVVAAKLLLVVPALLLVCGSQWKRPIHRAALVAAPVLGVYGVTIALAHLRGNPLPFATFDPSVTFSVSSWALLDMYWGPDLHLMRAGSAVLALTSIGATMLWFMRAGNGSDPMVLFGAMGTAMAAALVSFYHVNPEYYLPLLPLALVSARTRAQLCCVALATSAPWAANFFYGVAAAAAQASGGKAAFVDLYHQLLPMPPHAPHVLALVVTNMLTFLLAIPASSSALPGRATFAGGLRKEELRGHP